MSPPASEKDVEARRHDEATEAARSLAASLSDTFFLDGDVVIQCGTR